MTLLIVTVGVFLAVTVTVYVVITTRDTDYPEADALRKARETHRRTQIRSGRWTDRKDTP